MLVLRAINDRTRISGFVSRHCPRSWCRHPVPCLCWRCLLFSSASSRQGTNGLADNRHVSNCHVSLSQYRPNIDGVVRMTWYVPALWHENNTGPTSTMWSGWRDMYQHFDMNTTYQRLRLPEAGLRHSGHRTQLVLSFAAVLTSCQITRKLYLNSFNFYTVTANMSLMLITFRQNHVPLALLKFKHVRCPSVLTTFSTFVCVCMVTSDTNC